VTPYDRAMELVKLGQRDGVHTVLLEHRVCKVEVCNTPDPVEAAKLAAHLTIVLSRAIADAVADEAGAIAAQLNQHTLDGWGITAAEFTQWCRDRAEMHQGKTHRPCPG